MQDVWGLLHGIGMHGNCILLKVTPAVSFEKRWSREVLLHCTASGCRQLLAINHLLLASTSAPAGYTDRVDCSRSSCDGFCAEFRTVLCIAGRGCG